MNALEHLGIQLPEAARRAVEGKSADELYAELTAATERLRVADHQALALENQRAAAIAADKRGVIKRLPAVYAEATFADVPARAHGDAAQTAQHALVVDWSTRFADKFGENRGLSMVYLGGRGTGKTHLCCAVANGLMAKGKTVEYTTAIAMFGRIKDCYNEGKKAETEGAVFASLVHPDLLIIDEVGKGFATPSEQVWLFRVIDDRYLAGKSMLLISNNAVDQLETTLTSYGIDRLAERCKGKFLEFTWPKFRPTVGKARVDR